MDEHSLIDRILQGDQQAFSELVSLYQDHVYNTIIHFVRDEDDSMDLSQEVFVEVYLSLKTFRKESSLSTWIYRIAINKSLNHLQKKKRGQFISRLQAVFDPGRQKKQAEPEDRQPQPHQKMENAELGMQLQLALDSLPKNQRIAFTLHKFEELPYKEIAKIMGISLASVESLIFRARLGLQKKLLKYYRGH